MPTILDELKNIFPNTPNLTPAECAKILRKAKKTIYNQVSTNTFPVRVIYTGAIQKSYLGSDPRFGF